jgi:hypothetical protein
VFVAQEDIKRLFRNLLENNPRLYLLTFFDYNTREFLYILGYHASDGDQDVTRMLTPKEMYSFLNHIWLQGYKSGYIMRKHEVIAR